MKLDKYYVEVPLIDFEFVEELIPNRLWVAKSSKDISKQKSGWVKLNFLEFHSSEIDDSNILCNTVMYGFGYTGSSRELRHTYWGEDGYIFYPEAEKITAIVEYCKKYFDMN